MKNTYDFDFEQGEFVMSGGAVGILSGVSALELWINKTIRTQFDRYSIYDGKNYGANIEDLIIGKSYGFDFVESELKREIETALLKHDDILSLESFSVVKNGTILNISFTLFTVYGKLNEEVSYDS